MIKELYEDYFRNKKVTVMGLGLLGRGVGDTFFLKEMGSDIIVTDKKSKEELSSSLKILEPYKDIVYVLGEHRLEDFENRDFILKAAGVPYDSEYIKHANTHNIPVYMSASLVSDIVMKADMGVTIIGVTGTRGKSTVTHLIAHILKNRGMGVCLGGNIRGIANLPLLKEIKEGDFLVLELDSWQLQGFGDMKISPNISVFTSFLYDHMNYYRNDKERYFGDKANIYRYQKEYDVLIASPQAASEIMARENAVVVVPDQNHFDMKLIGEHNQIAAGLAYEVAVQCGLADDEIREAIKNFEGVEGRLEDMGTFGPHNVLVFNDNNATTPDATVVAIRSINEKYNKKPIVIIGGKDKDISLTELEDELQKNTKSCVFLSGTGTDKISISKEYVFDTLSECVDKVFAIANDNDIILFSPAFASFSKEFNNEYERNDSFVKAINNYK